MKKFARVPSPATIDDFLAGCLLFGLVSVPAHKLFDASGGVHYLLLTRVERVTEGADVDVNDHVLKAVDFSGLLRLFGGDANPFVLAIHKQNGVVNGVDIGLHSEPRKE